MNCFGEIHIWCFAGNPDYFPFEGMLCDCGLTIWEDTNKKGGG